MRRPSQIVQARQDAKAEARRAAIQERLTALVLAAPSANHNDLKYLAMNCGTNPTFPTLLRVLQSAQ